MPRRKKRITELPTDKAVKRLFPEEVIKLAKQVAHEKDGKPIARKEAS